MNSVLTENEKVDQESNSYKTFIEEEDLEEPLLSPLLIRISEVAWMGSDLSTADEWIELAAVPLLTGSVLTESVNLRGWSISIQKDAGEAVIANIETDLFIGSGSYVILANSSAATSRLRQEPAVISTSMSLPNTKLSLFLRDEAGVLQDQVDDFVGAPFAGVNPSAASGLPKATMERIDMRIAGIEKANWRTATTSRGFDAVSAMLGTPGYLNGSVEPPDITPPPDVERVQAYRFSGSVLIGWSNQMGSDATGIHLTAGTSVYDLAATATGITLAAGDIQSVYIRTSDGAGNISDGVEQAVQIITLPIITEVLPDPAGSDDEWIELGNMSADPLDLSGWVLQSGSKRFVLPAALLPPSSYLVFSSNQTTLGLPNAGGEVKLFYRGILIDQLMYMAMPDGVSFGRHSDMSLGSFCVPTPGAINTVMQPLTTLSGFLRGQPNPTGLNLEIRALSGSIAGAACTVDYGDGFIGNSCNPPSHTMKKSGHLIIKTYVQDFCGNTVIQEYPVQIVSGSSTKKPLVIAQSTLCRPSASSGIVVSEFLPAPSTGAEEWIELRNISGETINLCGWSVDDGVGGSRPFKLDALSIDAHQYLVVGSMASGLALNNDADSVRLIAPDLRGGTGVVLSVPYIDSETDVAFALREDGLIIRTPFLTPWSDNRFIGIDTTPGSSPVILSAAMPNPVGVDTWDEWLELTNATGRPQWLNGWYIEDTAGHRLELEGQVLAKRETKRLALYKQSVALANGHDVLRLIDDQGILRSVLAWQNAGDGRTIRIPQLCIEETFKAVTVTDGLNVRVKTQSGSFMELTPHGIVSSSEIFAGFVDNITIKNYLSALIKSKNIVQKKCSDSSVRLLIDGADIALLLLNQGYVVADPVSTGLRHDIFAIYEEQARSQRRGIWNNVQNGLLVDAWKQDRRLDHAVATEGLHITVSPTSGLLPNSSFVSVSTNVPADLWVKEGDGPYRRFDGGVLVRSNATLTFRAGYDYRTMSGGITRSSVVSQSYRVVQAAYPPCLRISEVYPSPKKGEREWVEVENICAEDISLLGWGIDDVLADGSKPYVISSNRMIKAGGHFVLSGSLLPIALNNGGDAVVLISPDKRIHQAMSYKKVPAGKSVALLNNEYCLTTQSTIGLNNKCVQEVTKAKTSKTSASAKKLAIGLSTKYVAAALLSGELNTKNDQYFSFMEGLNGNIDVFNTKTEYDDLLAIFLFLSGVCMTVAGGVLYGRKYRLFQR